MGYKRKKTVELIGEKEEKEMIKQIISVVQDEDQDLDDENRFRYSDSDTLLSNEEEIYRLGKWSEEYKRPLKVKRDHK